VVNQNIVSIREAMAATVEGFQRVVQQTQRVGTIVQEVQTSMDEQNRGGVIVLEGIRNLNEINSQVGDAVGDLGRTEADIQARAQDLARQNRRVNDNNREVRQRMGDIGGFIEQTASLAVITRSQIGALKQETSRFRTTDTVADLALPAPTEP